MTNTIYNITIWAEAYAEHRLVQLLPESFSSEEELDMWLEKHLSFNFAAGGPAFSAGYYLSIVDEEMPTPTPEPTTSLLFGVGIACFAALGRRRK